MTNPNDLTRRDLRAHLASVHADEDCAGAASDRPRRRSLPVHRRWRRLLDGISSWWVNIHGHAHPALNAALAAQAAQLEHVVFAGATHEPAVELAEQLIRDPATGINPRLLLGQRIHSG